jgi:DNA repair protein RadC
MTLSKKSIKNWSEDDRPREKLMAKGLETLSDSELIAILIGSGNFDQSAVELSRDILNSCNNNLNLLGKKSFQDLMEFRGIGQAKAISIVAALELGRRRKAQCAMENTKISSSKDVFELFQPILGDLPYEEFRIIYLNRANVIIDTIKISQGGTTGTVMDIKVILKNAILKFAQGIIVVHNHPSGNNFPSKSDKDITLKLKQAVKLFETELLDHVIIADNNYFSFADSGLL